MNEIVLQCVCIFVFLVQFVYLPTLCKEMKIVINTVDALLVQFASLFSTSAGKTTITHSSDRSAPTAKITTAQTQT